MGTTEDRSIAIPGFELLEKVGEGGKGTVYRARQLSLQRVVAVKVLRVPADGSAGPRAFQWETQLLASMSHPNVLAIHDCAQSQGQYYLVTEFVPGTSLRGLMEPGQPWPITRATALLDKVAGALSYIHRHGILHLDLKPENVLCTPEGELKIADFGLAQPQAEARVAAEHDQAQGTVDYCSLEQRHGLPADERSDLYSLAVLSYELLTGHLPGRAYEKASGHNAELPSAVDEVLRRGLARRQDQRQGSIEEFRRALGAALQPRSKRYWVWGATAAALVVLAGIFLARDPFRATEPVPVAPRAWLMGDELESLSAWARMTDARPEHLAIVQVGPRAPEGERDPPLPCWPTPRPVLFVKSAEGSAFFHPLFGLKAGRQMLAAWPALVRWPARLPEDNFVLAGDFGGKRVWEKDGGPWKRPPLHEWKTGEGIAVACPPDRPDDPALLLDSSGGTAASRLSCYQWLGGLPHPPGSVMVLRYRARAEEGKGRLSVFPSLPLVIPHNDRGALAEELRKRSAAHPYFPPQAGMDIRDYRLEDWVQPTTRWHTYCVVWEWPPYCTEPDWRNVVVAYQGQGKVWLDDVELFTWQRDSKR